MSGRKVSPVGWHGTHEAGHDKEMGPGGAEYPSSGMPPAEPMFKQKKEQCMKTQFIVTVTQTGDAEKHTAHALGEMVRAGVRGEVKNPDTIKITVRHVMDDTVPAADTLEALVREYGNSLATGKGRTRTDVLADIRALVWPGPRQQPGSQVAENSAKPSVPVEDAVAQLNALAGTNDKATGPQAAINRNADLEVLLSDAHRAGQLTGRLLGKEGRERANEYAAQMVATLAHT